MSSFLHMYGSLQVNVILLTLVLRAMLSSKAVSEKTDKEKIKYVLINFMRIQAGIHFSISSILNILFVHIQFLY